jgi:hypothetical protein
MTPESRYIVAKEEVHLLANGSPNTRSRSNEQTRKSIASQPLADIRFRGNGITITEEL